MGQRALRRAHRGAEGPRVTIVFFFIFIAFSLGITYVAEARFAEVQHKVHFSD